MEKQRQFLQECKERKNSKNFAQELADLLGVTLDAAYRRIRGTTPIIFSEIHKICLHYNLSFDSVINYEGRSFPFQFNPMFKDDFEILQYLEEMERQLDRLSQSDDSKILLTAMDLPYFRQFGFKSLKRFKLFFWQRSVLNLEEFKHLKFDANDYNEAYEEVTNKIYVNYHNFKSTEIWAPETLDSTLKQIEYYLESGLFKSKESAHMICDDLEELLSKLEREAMIAKKIINVDGQTYSSSFEMYQSDIFLSNNSIQAFTGGKVYSYVSFNSFNSLMSFSPSFSTECLSWIEQIRVKSILLSDVSEKLRYQFFQNLRGKIDQLRKSIT
ncbi:MAG: hypothetical protein OEW67_08005 [Cyclobacteriaceae bacterium]|nr:hypothetical protein [Cyclobacteriaceae bacterium]